MRRLQSGIFPVLFLFLSSLSAAATAACQFKNVAELPLSISHGHPMVAASINGKPVSMLFDTGSNWTVLSHKGVKALGLPVDTVPGYSYGVGGASSNLAAEVDEFALGPSVAKRITLSVMGSSSLGDDVAGLIGADYSMQMDLEVALADKLVRFFHTRDCDDIFLGYWDKEAMEVPLDWAGSFDKRPHVTVELNGKKFSALVDTGANVSTISSRLTKELGIQLDEDKADGKIGGVGEHKVNMWAARVNFKLGDESIPNVKMTFIADRFESSAVTAGVVLGQDWLRAHRVLFARSQKRMIFTYLGGNVFVAP